MSYTRFDFVMTVRCDGPDCTATAKYEVPCLVRDAGVAMGPGYSTIPHQSSIFDPVHIVHAEQLVRTHPRWFRVGFAWHANVAPYVIFDCCSETCANKLVSKMLDIEGEKKLYTIKSPETVEERKIP